MVPSLENEAAEEVEYAGPGAPHGAWPLEAAYFGTRGCHGPTYSVPESNRRTSQAKP